MNETQSGHFLHYKTPKTLTVNENIKLKTSRLSLYGKRAFDIMFSLAMIVILLSWLLPILALLIKLTSRGPVFFVQKRVGAYGKPFKCFKLRTMVVNPDAHTKQADELDPRITSIGRFLRVSNLDELPQFFNVLLGQMSVVGPRPHMLNDCLEFSSVIKNYHLRNMVKPGITGMAQVKGYRGKTKGYYDIFHRYKWDMFYVRNVSFHLDMRIIRLTALSTIKAFLPKLGILKEQEPKVTYLFEPIEAGEYLN